MNNSDAATLVKQAVDIVDVIGRLVPLRRSGNRHIGLCPFHHEKTPSFQVDGDNQLYYCFGCGSGGDVLSFVMKHQNLSFGEALKSLAEQYHIPLPERERSYDGREAEAVRKDREELFKVLDLATEFFYGQLHHSAGGRVARDYIEKRGLPEEVVETERLGYAPPEWSSLLAHLEERGADPEIGIKAGLLAKSQKDRIYDRFRNRLIFPIRDDRGRVVAFGGRSLSTDERQDEPKYLNSPETDI
ncbi:MAG: DNA primase [Acidobacteriota bacterium]